MFSVLAWSRAFSFALLLSTFAPSYASQETLFASSVTYCQPPETLLVQQFEIAYFPQNNSVVFNVSISSVQPNVNVSANIALSVYGLSPVNITLDLCHLLGGALCPLPMYNFTGADTIVLPSSLSVLEKIPQIAFQIPDIESFAQLTLTEVNTGVVKACIQATISNGRSAHQPAVEWTTAGIALSALFSAGWYSFASPEATVPFRFLELIYLYQSIASSSFLNLNYPSVYRAFSLNFAWAVGLIPSSTVQNSINRMRHLTGGHLANATDGSAVGLVNRKLSPFDSRSISDSSYIIRDAAGVQTVTAASPNVLQAGIPIFVNTIHIATANAFMTVFIFVLAMFAIAMIIFGTIFTVNLIRGRKRNDSVWHSFSSDSLSFVRGWFLRLSLLATFPLLTFIFYQWTLKDSWLSILLSVLTLFAIVALVGYPAFQTVGVARRESSSSLYEHNKLHLARNGPLYAQYSPSRYFFFLTFLTAYFIRAILIAFAHASGNAQLGLMIVLELSLVAAHLAFKPFNTRGGNVFSTYLAISRFVCTALMIAFIESLNVKAIPRVVIGIVIAVILSVSVIVVILNLVLHTLGGLLRRERGNVGSSSGSSDGSQKSLSGKGTGEGDTTPIDSEKGVSPCEVSSEDTLPHPSLTDEAGHERPVNRTPSQSHSSCTTDSHSSYPTDSHSSYPTDTIVTPIHPPSIHSYDSGTITIDSLLPTRWSFSVSPPSSPIGSSMGHARSSLTPSENGAGAISRNASVGHQIPRHQHQHDDIPEEPLATNSAMSPP